MQAFLSLYRAIEFIEARLTEPFSVEDVALAAFTSPSHLNRLFARVFHTSPANYILKRRLCAAAKALAITDLPITHIALDAQFSAPESFTRAFKKQYLMTPSEFRRQGKRFFDLYPKLTFTHDFEGGLAMSNQHRYDTSELRQKILSAKGTYILILDLDHLLPINENYGRVAGDAAIAAMASRIERAIGPDMAFFRTGGDEFTILTGSNDPAIAQSVAAGIASFAEEQVPYPGGTLTVSASIGIAVIPFDLDDPQTVLNKADAAMLEAKRRDMGGYRMAEE